MMRLVPAALKVIPFNAKGRVISRPHTAADDAHYWAEQAAGIAARQDIACFIRIYDHYAPRLLRYLLGLRVDAAQAEELVQESMLRLWRRAESFDPNRGSLSTWLFRIARNLYIDGRRREPAGRLVQEDVESLQIQEEDCNGGTVENQADHAGLARAIDALPAVQARLIRMSYLEAKSHSEIAAELEMPLGTVKSNLRRAFARLQAGLKGHS